MSQNATSSQNPTDQTPPRSDHSPLLVVYKPTGVNTHRTSENNWGFVEWLQEKLNLSLFLFQRLDQGTSGLLLIGRSEEVARDWTEKLKKKTVEKHYLFISFSTKKPLHTETIKSLIEKKRGQWVSTPSEMPNSETVITPLKSWKNFHLFAAQPKTGKSHQIRLHATDLGYPILGDNEHGGTPFFRLCLHAHQINDPSSQTKWSMEPPPYFDQLSLLEQRDLCALLDGAHQRTQLQNCGLLPFHTYRVSHREAPLIRMDRFGECYWAYDYRDTVTTDIYKTWLEAQSEKKQRPLWIREMKNRGHAPNESLLIPFNDPPQKWRAEENGLKFEMRSNQGLSPGLFLDQRENRKWVLENSQQKSVLNLFSYTCGFSVCAAAGGAESVVSVDVSKTFLEWGKANFLLNDLNPELYEFWSSDSIEFTLKALKRNRSFDMIICDPPSFGRSKRGPFKIDTHLPSLVQNLFKLLNTGGYLLLSTNFEKWDWDQWSRAATKNLPFDQFHFIPPPKNGLDFLESKKPLLKTLILKKSPPV